MNVSESTTVTIPNIDHSSRKIIEKIETSTVDERSSPSSPQQLETTTPHPMQQQNVEQPQVKKTLVKSYLH